MNVQELVLIKEAGIRDTLGFLGKGVKKVYNSQVKPLVDTTVNYAKTVGPGGLMNPATAGAMLPAHYAKSMYKKFRAPKLPR